MVKMLGVDIPPKEKLLTTGSSDPVRFYYHPILKYPFLKRLELLSNLFNRKGSSLLDIGYGSGIFFLELNKRFDKLFGIDVHDKHEIVQKMLREQNIIADLRQASVSRIPYADNMFDCVLSVSTLEHIEDLVSALKEISRVLKDNGEVILGFPSDNLIMRLLHYIFDRTPYDEMHVSGDSKIIGKIRDVFDIEKILTFPSFLPPSKAFYIGCRCIKKRQMR